MIRNFRLAIFLRVFTIVILSVTIAYIVVVKPMFFVLAAVFAVLIGLILNLIAYIEKTNRDLTHFLLSIRQGAFTESYTSGSRGKKHQQLSNALNEVVNEFAKVSREKELHYQFLQTLNENINVAILSFDDHGDLIMMNAASKRLLEMPSFSKLDHFRKIDPALHETVNTLQPEIRSVVKIIVREEILQLSIQMKQIVIGGKLVRIVLLQNLNNELETKEIDAWHQLIRVLTHEIMNSVTPIVSLTAAVENILRTREGNPRDFASLSSENIDDIFSSLKTIQSRSHGLLKFITSYKEFSRPMDASFEQLDVAEIIDRTVALFQPQLASSNITLELEIARPLLTQGDQSLLEQVLINLVKNALEATPHDGSGIIRIVGRKKNQQTMMILVYDNGSGIDDEILPRIFIPFFTTKQKGSGIGLSLSRQIMKLHSGSLKVQTSGKGSVFVMEW